MSTFALPRQSVACVLVTHLPAKAELRRNADLADKPFIVTHETGKKRVVLDYSQDVKGVSVGMPLQAALSRANGVQLVQADEPHYRKVFDSLSDALLQRSPVVERGELGCIYVGLKGLASMYGDEARLTAALIGAMPSELRPRVGVAAGKFPAYVGAMSSTPGDATKVPDEVARFLRNRPVELLPVPWRTKERLHTHGLHTIGQVAALGVGPLQAQFGVEGRRMWELANGVDTTPLMPLKTQEEISEWLSFPIPTQSLDTILVALETLLDKTFARQTVARKLARRAVLEARVLGKPTWTKEFAFKQPVGSKERAFFPLKGMLEGISLPGPFEDIKLTLPDLTGDTGMQSSLLTDVRQQEFLERMMEQLAVRLRTQPPVFRLRDADRDSIIPEQRTVLVPVGSKDIRPMNTPVPVRVKWDRHGRPTSVLTNTKLVRVARIEDIWEIQSYWWRDRAVARKYFRVVLDNGGKFDLFCDPATGEWFRQRYS